jgi:hypothetical protein
MSRLATIDMSTALATTLGLGIYAAMLIPLGWIVVRGNARTIAAAYLVLVLAFGAYHTGVFQRSSLTPADIHMSATVPNEAAQCEKILELMERSGLTVERPASGPSRLVGEGADQVPAEVRDVLIQCSEARARQLESTIQSLDRPDQLRQ